MTNQLNIQSSSCHFCGWRLLPERTNEILNNKKKLFKKNRPLKRNNKTNLGNKIMCKGDINAKQLNKRKRKKV